MSLGESILDHYELFLGKYIGVDKYTSGEYVIQLLGFDRTFNIRIFRTVKLFEFN